MEASTSRATIEDSDDRIERSVASRVEEVKKPIPGGTFKCAYCSLEEHYDYKGAKPPFARHIRFSEDCYMMKDPMSKPNRGQVLVLGGDCGMCKKVVCLGCSLFYVKRFCSKCANDYINSLPSELHGKIKSLTNEKKS